MKKMLTLTCLLVLLAIQTLQAQFSLTTTSVPVTEDFQTFDASGCTPTPTPGQLDTKRFALYGLTIGTGPNVQPRNLPFEDTAFVVKFARGFRYPGAAVTNSGVYSYADTVNAGTNRCLWFQPTGADFTPGDMYLRAKNNTGNILTDVDFSFDWVYLNDQARVQSLNVFVSTDSVNYTEITALADTTLGTADAILYTINKSVTLSGLSIADGTAFFIKISTNDKSGQGARDEMGFDNITFTPLPVSISSIVAFNPTTLTVGENVGTTSLSIEQSIATACSVDYVVSGGSATNGTDFSLAATNPIVFDGVNTTVTIDLTIVDDILVEGTETLTLTLINPTAGCVVSSTGALAVSITDNDLPDALLSFPQPVATLNEGVGTINLPINQNTATACSVEVAIVGGTATAPADFTLSSPALVVFDGLVTSQILSIPVIDDALIEGTETVILVLQNPTAGCALGATDSLTVNIQDNDLPLYTIGAVTTTDANNAPDSLNVRCRLVGKAYGANYRQSANGLSFAISDATGSIWVFSTNKQFGYSLTEGDNVGVEGTILNFNGQVQIQLDTIVKLGNATVPTPTVTTVVNESLEADLIQLNTMKLVNPAAWTTGTPPNGFTVRVTNNVDTFTVRIDNDIDAYQMPAPTCTWFNVAGVLSQFDPSSPYTTGYQLMPRRMSDFTCLPNPSLAMSTTTATVLESVGTVTVSVDISNPNPDATTATIGLSGTATTATDYTASATSVTFPGNSTTTVSVTLTITDDILVEAAETVILTLTNPTNNATVGTPLTITITDNDQSGITPVLPSEAVTIFPNPGTQALNIQTDIQPSLIVVYDVLGAKVYESTSLASISTATWANGIYAVKILTEQGVWMGKWVKE